MTEVLGARTCIFVKDLEGLFTEDPPINPNAELIEDITIDKLIMMDMMDMEDMVMEHKLLYLLREASNMREIRIVNGHKRGKIEKAVKGEKVGTRIRE